MPPQPHFHFWIPNMFGFKGGIQVYSSFLLRAVQSLYPEATYDVFLMHDTAEDQASSNLQFLPSTRFHFTGHVPTQLRAVAYAAQLMGHALLQQPTLVITTHLSFTVVAQRLKQLAKIPYWTVAHGVEAWNLKRPTVQRALHQADRILAVSNYTRDRLLNEQNLSPEKVVLQPNTFDSDRFQICPKSEALLRIYKLHPNQPILLTVCRLCQAESYRPYDKVLEALPLIQAKIPNVHYLIVGKGNDRSRLEASIQQSSLEAYVTLTGFVPDEALCDYYNFCDLFIMPSKLEGFGIVYLEAMACGKPVLGGNQDGAVDALNHGRLGTLVDPDNSEHIAQAAVNILQKSRYSPELHKPQWLRHQVISAFGVDSFEISLAQHFLNWPNSSERGLAT